MTGANGSVFRKAWNEIGQRHRMLWIHDLLQLENIPVRIAPICGAEHAYHLRLSMKFDARLFQPPVFGKNVDYVERDMGHAGVARGSVWFVVLPFGMQILEDFDMGVSGAK